MNSPVEDRLREALGEAGATVEVGTLRPLMVPDRRRFGVNMRLGLVGAAAVVVAGAATVVGLTGVTGSGADDGVTMAASRPQAPVQADVSVFLCTGRELDQKACQGRAATEEQKTALAESLRRIPGVASVYFEDRPAAYQRFRRVFAGDPDVLGKVKADELPESYRIMVSHGTELKAVSGLAEKMPGVALVSDRTMTGGFTPASFRQAPMINVFLCGPSSREPTCDTYAASKPSRHGKAITNADLKKLEQQIKAMPEVREVRFEDQAHAYAQFKRSFTGNKALLSATKVEDMPQSFRISLKPGVDTYKVAPRLHRPGVAQVVVERCLALPSLLRINHGVDRNDICG
ncbi:hypothetical protein GCM10010149_58860 [Nonomuraea roseoviolacea subsp. roseoviolacea]|uniref:permease-like cell division protein FtsX n=1 Tax=Nonomuraea roseoviolacea TaxID=103837 RepID=UPI0031D9FFFC